MKGRAWRVNLKKTRAECCVVLISLLRFETFNKRVAMVLWVAPGVQHNCQGDAGNAKENDDAKEVGPKSAIHFGDEIGDLGWKFAWVTLILNWLFTVVSIVKQPLLSHPWLLFCCLCLLTRLGPILMMRLSIKYGNDNDVNCELTFPIDHHRCRQPYYQVEGFH